MRLFIIGYKNSGKTTMGRKLANRLNMEFVDLDDVIEKRENMTIPDLYNKVGDERFRVLEWKALKEVVEKDNIIVSTGGGAPIHCDNMNIMNSHGTTVYLKLDEDTLVGRLKHAAKNRPIVKGKTPEQIREYVKDLLEKYEHFYLSAKYVVDAKNLSPEDIVARIITNYAS